MESPKWGQSTWLRPTLSLSFFPSRHLSISSLSLMVGPRIAAFSSYDHHTCCTWKLTSRRNPATSETSHCQCRMSHSRCPRATASHWLQTQILVVASLLSGQEWYDRTSHQMGFKTMPTMSNEVQLFSGNP